MTTSTCTCRRCGRNLDPASQIEESQESIQLSFRGGYGSVFGDGNIVQTTLCQHCLKELLGEYLEVIEDDPFEPRHKAATPRGAYQPGQIAAPAEDDRPPMIELRKMFAQAQKDHGGDD